MGFLKDTDDDGAGWDNALDKAAMIGGVGLAGLGGITMATGGLLAATGFGAPLGAGVGLAGAGMTAAGSLLAVLGDTQVVGDLSQAQLAMAQMVHGAGTSAGQAIGNGIVGAAESAHDFLFPPAPPSLEDVM